MVPEWPPAPSPPQRLQSDPCVALAVSAAASLPSSEISEPAGPAWVVPKALEKRAVSRGLLSPHGSGGQRGCPAWESAHLQGSDTRLLLSLCELKGPRGAHSAHPDAPAFAEGKCGLWSGKLRNCQPKTLRVRDGCGPGSRGVTAGTGTVADAALFPKTELLLSLTFITR